MHIERYDPKIHGRVGRRGRDTSEWDRLFESVAQGPVVVKGVSRNSIYHHARTRSMVVRVQALADGDGYVVSVA